MNLESEKSILINNSALSESAQSILKVRPSFWVRYGGPFVLSILIISTLILIFIKYTPTSEWVVVSRREILGVDSLRITLKTNSLKLFHSGEKVEIVSLLDKNISFFGNTDSIYSIGSYQYLSMNIDSSFSKEIKKTNMYLIKQESEVFMNLIMNRKIQDK
ncbi:hypothetical protein [Sphingobacterium anhuiense]|uniref:Uncharacterized protein n=1 Tax=Sphingobacterium anhuiense TaxID=493780 RepID=A0ABW5YQ61_9SPHI